MPSRKEPTGKGGNPNPSSRRFSSEYNPRTGRIPGAVAKSTVKRKVDEALEKMLGQAHSNINKALKKGDVRVSMWVVDTVRKVASDRIEPGLLDPLVAAVETFEDIEQISQQALMLAIKGDLTFDQVRAIQEALARHSVLKGVIELADLRREIAEMREAEEGITELGTGHVPSWGKLIDAKPLNKSPAE